MVVRVKKVVCSILAGEILAVSHGLDSAIFPSTLDCDFTTGGVKVLTLITSVTVNVFLARQIVLCLYKHDDILMKG